MHVLQCLNAARHALPQGSGGWGSARVLGRDTPLPACVRMPFSPGILHSHALCKLLIRAPCTAVAAGLLAGCSLCRQRVTRYKAATQ